jgi:hypothetical protein
MRIALGGALTVCAVAAGLLSSGPAQANGVVFSAPARSAVPDELADAVTLPETGDHVAVNPPADVFGDRPVRRFLAKSNMALDPATVDCSATSGQHAAAGLNCSMAAATALDDNGQASLWLVCLRPADDTYPQGTSGDTVTVAFTALGALKNSIAVTVDDTPPEVDHGWTGGVYPGAQANTVEWSADDGDGSGLIDGHPAYATSYRWIRSARYSTTQGQASFADDAGTQSLGLTLNSGFTTYCMAVYAEDLVGNLSISGIAPVGDDYAGTDCTVIPGDDHQLAPANGFVRSTGANYSNGTVSYAQRLGATLTVPGATAKTVVVKARTCPTCGAYEVLLGSRRLGSVSLAAPDGFRTTFFAAPAETTGSLVLRTTSARWTAVDQVWATGPCVGAVNCFGLA